MSIYTPTMTAFQIGDRVEQRTGPLAQGTVVAVFFTLAGEVRYVVEAVAGEKLHIYNAGQLREAHP